jgi:hypothetical protein
LVVDSDLHDLGGCGDGGCAGVAVVKHTPGPWLWWTSNSWKRLKRDAQGITENVLEPYVCRDGQPDVACSEADMRLIAAAPDLLDALEKVHFDVSSCGVVRTETQRELQAAIKKARGE